MIKKLLFLVLLGYGNSYAQTQIGADIDGEAAGDYSGVSVSISANGNIVAIGSSSNDGNGTDSGHVRIYQNVSGIWTQIGADINGEAAYDNSGRNVSLSADGSVVAIASTSNDGNGNNSGHVRVYQNLASTWTQIGTDIDGEAAGDLSGVVSISANGNIVAIGAYGNDGNGSNSGHVRVYQNVSGVWTQIGADIDGEAAGDYSGVSVSISANGNIVAIGSSSNDGNGTDSGHVRIYQNVSGIWTQIGVDINGEAAYDNSGRNVSLSANGNIVAIGSYPNDGNGTDSGHVRVYNLSGVLSSNSIVQSNFFIYPNPSKGSINIALENNLQLEKVIIYNQLGQVVKTATTNIITTSELAKGAYFVEVLTNEGKATKQLIVE
jgi:Flp pilus assembly pilin Flp